MQIKMSIDDKIVNKATVEEIKKTIKIMYGNSRKPVMNIRTGQTYEKMLKLNWR